MKDRKWRGVIENSGTGVLTPELLQEAFDRMIHAEYTPPVRIISWEANKLLERIRQVEPGWDSFNHAVEIYWKAQELGIKTGSRPAKKK